MSDPLTTPERSERGPYTPPPRQKTPVPRREDGSIDWASIVKTAGIVLGLLGVGTGGGMALGGSGDSEKLARLEAEWRASVNQQFADLREALKDLNRKVDNLPRRR